MRWLAALAFMLLLVVPGSAPAQLISKWGHPVFTFGSTPYDSINTGHGNYPGGPGFIPGYGYYPGPGPGRYPWMDGPDTPFDRRKLSLPNSFLVEVPPEAAALAAGAALIIVRLPAEAELWFNKVPTTQTGSYRRFLSPPLPAGRTLLYTARARWRLQDVELQRVETVEVQPGAVSTVDLLTVDSWTGRRLTRGSAAAAGKKPAP
jgi:uncharacterized protein (TIGR03000 family)